MKIEAKARALDKIFKRRDRYEIPDWQREEVWSEQKKQSLIDSILKGWTLPKFYFLKTSDNPEEFEVVDGQQRLAAIFDFFDNLLSLPPSGSKPGKLYKQLSENQSDAFDDFEIQYDEITEASEPEIKEFFQRLQQGLPLTSSERLNAVHSNLQKFCKDLTKSKFFTASIALADKRYSHFDVAAKFAAVQIGGLATGLRFEDLKELFSTQKNFSIKSPIALQLKATLEFLERSFPEKTPVLRNRSFVQSVVTLASLLVATGNSTGKEKRFNKFINWFFSELSRQIELGLDASDADFVSFQRSINANVRAGAKDRHNILVRKLVAYDPLLASVFDPAEILSSGVKIEIKRIAESIKHLVETTNDAYSSKNGKDLFKMTNKTVAALSRLSMPIADEAGYSRLVTDLYFLFWEGPGERLAGKEPQSFVDINVARTDLQHDVDHGKVSKVAKKKKLAAETFKKYSTFPTPGTAPPESFPIFQAAILFAVEQDLVNVVKA
jgi:hypothetical protein